MIAGGVRESIIEGEAFLPGTPCGPTVAVLQRTLTRRCGHGRQSWRPDHYGVGEGREAAPGREILEVIEAPLGVRYSVRCVDGHESTFRPSAGSSRIVAARRRKPAQASD
jgi:hypothetical protein